MTRAAKARPARLRLNTLSGSEWVRFTKSWFITHPSPRSASERLHPAKFPEDLCESFVRFFTSPGEWVLDPFAGTGSALVAAEHLGRRAVGLEVQAGYAELANRRLQRAGSPPPRGDPVVVADARQILGVWRRHRFPRVQFILTSPPYWDMLGKSRGGSRSAHRNRSSAGLPTTYSRDPNDLGNIHDYGTFLGETVRVLLDAASLLEPGRYAVVVAQNLRDVDGQIRTLAWDLARALDRPPLELQGERIWCQDAKPLGIWGFPSTFVPNYHHHYCLIFRRRNGAAGDQPERPRRTTAERSDNIRSATSR